MKPRKRGRSPNLDCEECLPISKRITRLNIQAPSRQSIEEKIPNELQNQCYNGLATDQSNGLNVQLPWQQTGQPQVNSLQQEGNNNECFPCGSQQCDSGQTMANKDRLQAYADFHKLPKEDLSGYSPDLGEGENPHYYSINSVLYRAHLEKALRKGTSIKH